MRRWLRKSNTSLPYIFTTINSMNIFWVFLENFSNCYWIWAKIRSYWSFFLFRCDCKIRAEQKILEYAERKKNMWFYKITIEVFLTASVWRSRSANGGLLTYSYMKKIIVFCYFFFETLSSTNSIGCCLLLTYWDVRPKKTSPFRFFKYIW